MKTLDKAFLIAGLVSLSVLIGVSSCGGDEEGEESNKPSREAIETRISGNKWKVSGFYDDKDETHQFYGYAFEFNPDGSVVATNLNSSIAGTWSTFNSTNGQIKLNFEFMLVSPFDEISEDWVIVESTDTHLILEDLGQRFGEPDKLTLEKVWM